MPNLTGKRVLVTGSSKGIGRGIALRMAREGADVVINYRSDPEGAEEVRAEVEALGRRAACIQADLGNTGDVRMLVDKSIEVLGGLDVLVNNAGVGLFAPVAEMSVDEWQQVLETNLSGVFYCSHAAIPHLKKRGGGWIINISSLAGKNAFVGGAAYCASKAGLNAFSEALMQEVRYDNIRVSYIMPGSVATGFAGRGAAGEADWKIAPEDVAELVTELVTFPSRSLPSRLELRPSRPQK
jgi:3-oxoacyl-[acyl-carrier protein] reductase